MGFYVGCGLVLIRNDRYVLVQEVRHAKKGLFNLPAGTLNVDEDIASCMVREAEEETGARVSLEYFIGIYQTILADGNNILFFVFAATADQGTDFHSEEHEVIKLLTYDEVAVYNRAGRLRSPIVLKSIEDYQAGQRFPLATVQAWHFDKLSAITVDKGH